MMEKMWNVLTNHEAWLTTAFYPPNSNDLDFTAQQRHVQHPFVFAKMTSFKETRGPIIGLQFTPSKIRIVTNKLGQDTGI